MKRIVVMGRGGVGKTSFTALVTKFFIEIGETPLLLVDVDPDQNLAEMVGVDLKEEGKQVQDETDVETINKVEECWNKECRFLPHNEEAVCE